MWVKIGQGDDLSSPFSYSTNTIAIMDNNYQKQKEQQHAVFKGILNALNNLNGNLSTAGEEEGTSVSVLERIATALETIAERLNPVYTAEYTEPEPAEEVTPENPGEDEPQGE